MHTKVFLIIIGSRMPIILLSWDSCLLYSGGGGGGGGGTCTMANNEQLQFLSQTGVWSHPSVHKEYIHATVNRYYETEWPCINGCMSNAWERREGVKE